MTRAVVRRVWAPLNRYTFEIPVVAELLRCYVGNGAGWADPFAGKSTLAQYRNDLDPSTPQPSHVDAVEFARALPDGLEGVLMDPPYTREQVSRHYRAVGREPTVLDTSNRFYSRVQNVVARKVRPGGHAISFGYTGIGLGLVRRFEEVEALIMLHGAGHYSTQVIVERKADHVLEEFEP